MKKENMKKRKQILTTLGAGTILSGVAIGAVAQMCNPDSPADTTVTAFFNNTVLSTNSNGYLTTSSASSGLENFWMFYQRALDSIDFNIDVANTTFLSDVMVSFTITNEVANQDNTYSFDFNVNSVQASVLGLTERTDFAPSTGRENLFSISYRNATLDMNNIFNIEGVNDLVNSDFSIETIAQQATTSFYNLTNENNVPVNIFRAITESNGFTVNGATDSTDRGFITSNTVSNFSLSRSIQLSDVTIILPPNNASGENVIVEVSLAGIDISYEWSGFNYTTQQGTASLSFVLSLNANYDTPRQQILNQQVAGDFNFFAPDIALNNVFSPENRNPNAAGQRALTAVGIALLSTTDTQGRTIRPTADGANLAGINPLYLTAAQTLWDATGLESGTTTYTNTNARLDFTSFASAGITLPVPTATTTTISTSLQVELGISVTPTNGNRYSVVITRDIRDNTYTFAPSWTVG